MCFREFIKRFTSKKAPTKTIPYNTRSMLRHAKDRAIKKGIEFSITKADIPVPETCPLLDIKLSATDGIPDTRPSIDRIDPALGYVKGNVWVVSTRANQIKSNASWQELELIAKRLKEKINEL